MRSLSHIRNRDHFPVWLTTRNLIEKGVEIGVFRGEYSNTILQSWPGKLVGVDCYNNGAETYLYDHAMKLNAIFQDRYELMVDLSTVAATRFDPDTLDFVYIDADHSCESVKQDIAAWWGKIKQGGILAGHDFYPQPNDFGPGNAALAVNEFAIAHALPYWVTPCSSWFIAKS